MDFIAGAVAAIVIFGLGLFCGVLIMAAVRVGTITDMSSEKNREDLPKGNVRIVKDDPDEA